MESLHLETRRCVEIPRRFRRKVNIICNTDSSIILWSKYMIIKYSNVEAIFDSDNSEPNVIDFEFAVEKVLFLRGDILCLDCTGNININAVTPSHSDFSRAFTINKTDIIACELLDEKVICLKIMEHHTVLSIYTLNEMLEPIHKFKLNNPNDSEWKDAPRDKNIICGQYLPIKELSRLGLAFNVTESNVQCLLVVMCLDKRNIYYCIIQNVAAQDSNVIVKLYESLVEIVGINICIEKECLLVGLSSGNIIKLSLSNNEPQLLVHLNTALYKFAIINNTIIYTNGLTMWKNDDIYTNSALNPKQYFVKNVQDFCVTGDKIVCTTFSNLIYCFNINDTQGHLSPNEGEARLTNSYLHEILNITQKNEEEIQKINQEKAYMLALSLSNRHNLMDSLIHVTSDVFENFNDVEQNVTELTLTDNRDAYSDNKSYYFVIKISVTPIQHKLNKLLSNVLGDIKIHITLFTDKVLKTTSIKINEQLRKKNFVIPLKRREMGDTRELQAVVKIVTNIPGKMDDKQRQWTTLYSTSMALNVEEFIKTTNNMNSICLKRDETPLDNLICDIATHYFGRSFSFKLSDSQDV